MSRRSGLGRGLAALIPPSTPAQETASESDDRPAAGPAGADVDDGSGTADAGRDDPGRDDADTAAPAAPERDVVDRPDPVADGEEQDADLGTTDLDDGTTFRVLPAPGVATSGAEPATADLAEDRPDGGDAEERHDAPGHPDDGAPAIGSDTGRGGPMVAASAATLADLDLDDIVPNPRQPREIFDPGELEGLAISLADIGILQPLVVRPMGDGRYELIAGERRLRAARLAGIDRVPAVVRHTDDADLLKEALVENIHRVQLNPLEEGAAYQQLLEEFGVTQEELAASLGRSRPAISNAIRLLQLPTEVQRRVAAGVLSAGHAKALLSVEDPQLQSKLAERIVTEGLSVRATEELVRLRLLDAGAGGSSSSRRRGPTAPGLVELQEDLSDALMARVRISMGARKGKLAIEFASVDDLERIVAVIANGLQGGDGPSSPRPIDPRGTDDGPAG